MVARHALLHTTNSARRGSAAITTAIAKRTRAVATAPAPLISYISSPSPSSSPSQSQPQQAHRKQPPTRAPKPSASQKPNQPPSSSSKDPRPSFNIRPIYESRPRAINALTFGKTREHLDDRSHPLYEVTRRRMAAFNGRAKLHWTVRCSTDFNKKPVVRSWARRRVREGFRIAMRERGWGPEGELLVGCGGAGGRRLGEEIQTPLVGVLLLMINKKHERVLTSSWEEIKAACRASLAALLVERARQELKMSGRRSGNGARQMQGTIRAVPS